MKIVYHVMSAPAPLGLIFLAASERGLRYTEFMDRRSIKRIIASHEADSPGAEWEASLLKLKQVVDQFEAYFCGALTRFELPLDPLGSGFQLETWNALRTIPYGETRTYGEIARAIGQPRAARAIGLANHDNPIAIIVPCHRVIGADGSLTGYGGGLQRKRWLLRHEARFAAQLLILPRAATAQDGGRSAATSRESASVVAAAAPAQRARPAVASAPARSARVTPASTPAKRARIGTASAASRRARSAPRSGGAGRRASSARTSTRSTARRHAR